MIQVSDQQLQEKIKQVYENDQAHIFRFWDELNESGRSNLLNQIKRIDFELLNQLIEFALKEEKDTQEDLKLEPGDAITLKQREDSDKEAIPVGEDALHSHQVAAFLVAGGQGSRLGFDGPKGVFKVTPVKKKPLFQLHAEKLLRICEKYETVVPWYIMTSETNHEDTIRFFEDNDFFGYEKANVMFFKQDMIPAVDHSGKLILSERDRIFMSPNGHGGSIKALWESGAIKDMQERGIKYIFYFQVDNVLTKICDPAFLGYHIADESEMSNKVVRKQDPKEKVGVICKINGKTGVVEYSDLSEEDMYATDENGQLKYWAGSIATHVINVDFIKKENRDGFKLPYHKAEKNIPYIDENGKEITPEGKNGVKFETFVFDALLHTDKITTVEVDGGREFSALKNAEGSESPETVEKDLLRNYASWLKAAGTDVETDDAGLPKIKIEISPLFAINEADVRQKKQQIPPLHDGIYIK